MMHMCSVSEITYKPMCIPLHINKYASGAHVRYCKKGRLWHIYHSRKPKPTQALHPKTQGCCILTRIRSWKTARSALFGSIPLVKPDRPATHAQGDSAAAKLIATKAVLQLEVDKDIRKPAAGNEPVWPIHGLHLPVRLS